MNKFIETLKKSLKSFKKDPLFLHKWEDPYYDHYNRKNRLSVNIRGIYRRKSFSFSIYSSMFIEDMFSGIMPLMHRAGEREKYPAKIEPDSPKIRKIVSTGISEYKHLSFLEDAICNFVQNTTQTLFSDGIACYEIIVKREEKSMDIESFELVPLQPFYLYHFMGNYYQFVPPWEAKACHTKVQIIKIPENNILRIVFPESLGGKSKISRIVNRLQQLSKDPITPQFQSKAIMDNRYTGFDSSIFNRGKYLEIARLTKAFGWHQRQYTDNYISEYYSMTRFLRSKKTEAIVRNEVITKLNEALNGSLLNLGVIVKMDNLTSIEDVERQEILLKNGNVAFMDVFKSFPT